MALEEEKVGFKQQIKLGSEDTIDWLIGLESETSALLARVNDETVRRTFEHELLSIWKTTGELIREKISAQNEQIDQSARHIDFTASTSGYNSFDREQQAMQCKHLSALLCHNIAQIKQLIRALEALACRSTAKCIQEDSYWENCLGDQLRNVQEERLKLESTMASIQELSSAFELAEQSCNECENLKQVNALQAAKHWQGWQRAKREHERIRRCSLSKLNRLSRALIHRRRAHLILHAWSDCSRAKTADHDLVYKRRVQCCMVRPCIQCEHLWQQHRDEHPEKAGSETGGDLFSLSESETEYAIAQARKPRDELLHGEETASRYDSCFSTGKPPQLQEHEIDRVRETVVRLMRLISMDENVRGEYAADHIDGSESGILGVAFGVDYCVIELMPNSPAYECGFINIGDKLLQIDGRTISEECRSKLKGTVGTTVELLLMEEKEEMTLEGEVIAGRVKSVKLTRASATEVAMSNWSLSECIESLAQYVEAHMVCRGAAACTAISGKAGLHREDESEQREKKERKAVMPAAALQDNERRMMQDKEVKLTLENRLLKQRLAESEAQLSSLRESPPDSHGDPRQRRKRSQSAILQDAMPSAMPAQTPENYISSAGHATGPVFGSQPRATAAPSGVSSEGLTPGNRARNQNKPLGRESQEGSEHQHIPRRRPVDRAATLVESCAASFPDVCLLHVGQSLVLGLILGASSMILYMHWLVFGAGSLVGMVSRLPSQEGVEDFEAMLALVTTTFASTQQTGVRH